MDRNRIHPDLQVAYDKMPNVPVHLPGMLPLLRLLMPIMAKRMAPATPITGVRISEEGLGPAAVRIIEPSADKNGDTNGGGLVWIHGGGMVLGAAESDDAFCAELATELGITVFSVEYRLAPKHPFPAAIDDCFTVWQWVQQEADRFGVDRNRIGIAGASAGGGLAAALTQRVHDSDGPGAACQGLIYPMLDDRTAVKRELDGDKHRIWSNKSNLKGWRSYLGKAFNSAAVPDYAVPARRDDLSGLAPAWIGVGDIDLFHDEDCVYADRLKAAGVECELLVSPGAPHGFERMVPDTEPSKAFTVQFKDFLRRYLTTG